MEEQISRNTLLQKTYKGCHLARRFLSTAGEDETVLATLVGLPTCDVNTGGGVALALESRYGLPEYEQFSTDGNVDVGVSYGPNGVVARADFDTRQHLVDNRSDIPVLNEAVVERLINYFAPPETMLNPKGRTTGKESDRNEIVAADNFTTTRSYHDGVLTHASITWK